MTSFLLYAYSTLGFSGGSVSLTKQAGFVERDVSFIMGSLSRDESIRSNNGSVVGEGNVIVECLLNKP